MQKEWGDWIAKDKIILPEHGIDGLNLIWLSDFVISESGTMNREATALGVPVYSIFRAGIGAVDRYLAAKGRLILLESVEDMHKKIVLGYRPSFLHGNDNSAALDFIIDAVVSIAETSCPR